MNETVIRVIDECIYQCNKAIQLNEQDIDNYPNCVGGQLLDEYRKTSEEVADVLSKIKQDLYEVKTTEANKSNL